MEQKKYTASNIAELRQNKINLGAINIKEQYAQLDKFADGYEKKIREMCQYAMVCAETANDPDTPSMRQRRQARNNLKVVIEKRLKEIEKRVKKHLITDAERAALSMEVIAITDTYNVMTANNNNERAELFKKNLSLNNLLVTHETMSFVFDSSNIGMSQGGDKETMYMATVQFYNDLTNNDENYKQFLKLKKPEEVHAFMFDNDRIRMTSIFVSEMVDNVPQKPQIVVLEDVLQ